MGEGEGGEREGERKEREGWREEEGSKTVITTLIIPCSPDMNLMETVR